MWRTFNCGIGFVLVVPAAAAAAVESDLDRLALSHRRTGAVVKATGGDRVRIDCSFAPMPHPTPPVPALPHRRHRLRARQNPAAAVGRVLRAPAVARNTRSMLQPP